MPLKYIKPGTSETGHEIYQDLVAQLVSRRQQLGISQEVVAEKMECHLCEVQAFERGDATPEIWSCQIGDYAAAVGVCFDITPLPEQPPLDRPKVLTHRKPGSLHQIPRI